MALEGAAVKKRLKALPFNEVDKRSAIRTPSPVCIPAVKAREGLPSQRSAFLAGSTCIVT